MKPLCPNIDFFKTSILPFVLDSNERRPGPTVAALACAIRNVILPPFNPVMIPGMLDAVTLLESVRKELIKKARVALKWQKFLEGHAQGGDTQAHAQGAGIRILDPADIRILETLLVRDEAQRVAYRGIIDRCIRLVSKLCWGVLLKATEFIW